MLLEGLKNKTYEEQLRELGLRESGAEERLRGNLIAISYLNEGCSQLGVILFCETQGLKLHQGMFSLCVWKNFILERVIRHWKRLPRELVETPSLEVFKQ